MQRTSNGQQVHEKVLIITNYQGSAHQNHHEMPPHAIFRTAATEDKREHLLARSEEREPLLYSCWECKLVQLLRKTVWRFFKEIKRERPQDRSTYFTSGYNLQRTRPHCPKGTPTPPPSPALCATATSRKQPKRPTMANKGKGII